MSLIDKAVAAITPQPSADRRAQATRKARAMAGSGDWLDTALDHHDEIRAILSSGCDCTTAAEREAVMKDLAAVLNPHSIAEETVLYPGMAQGGHKVQANLAYTQQTAAKMQIAELENIDPSADDWADKWGHIEGAILTHIFEEENGWFIHLKEHGENQDRLTARFREEFERCGGDRGRAS